MTAATRLNPVFRPIATQTPKSALGAKYRRLRARLGAPKAIVAMAHHLARLVYRMLRYGEKYVEKGIEHYEHKFRLQRMCSTSRFYIDAELEGVQFACRSKIFGPKALIRVNGTT
jgi:hypothetical protein